jgi:hypothetical protein
MISPFRVEGALTLAPEIARAMAFGYRRIDPTSGPERALTF